MEGSGITDTLSMWVKFSLMPSKFSNEIKVVVEVAVKVSFFSDHAIVGLWFSKKKESVVAPAETITVEVPSRP